MFITEYKGWAMKGAKAVNQKCSNCSNTTDHYVYVAPKGLQMGTIFSKKPLIGARVYFLACPTCGSLNKELTKQQAQAAAG